MIAFPAHDGGVAAAAVGVDFMEIAAGDLTAKDEVFLKPASDFDEKENRFMGTTGVAAESCSAETIVVVIEEAEGVGIISAEDNGAGMSEGGSTAVEAGSTAVEERSPLVEQTTFVA